MASGKKKEEVQYYMVRVPPERRSHLVVDGQVFYIGSLAAVSASEFSLLPPEGPLEPDNELLLDQTYRAMLYLDQEDEERPVDLTFTVTRIDEQGIRCRIERVSDRGQEMLHRFVHQVQQDDLRQKLDMILDLVQVKEEA